MSAEALREITTTRSFSATLNAASEAVVIDLARERRLRETSAGDRAYDADYRVIAKRLNGSFRSALDASDVLSASMFEWEDEFFLEVSREEIDGVIEDCRATTEALASLAKSGHVALSYPRPEDSPLDAGLIRDFIARATQVIQEASTFLERLEAARGSDVENESLETRAKLDRACRAWDGTRSAHVADLEDAGWSPSDAAFLASVHATIDDPRIDSAGELDRRSADDLPPPPWR